ncbi:hypothetical protein V6N12_040227 [Hibiscus sabdariffa]|uniref:Uncharacterized protein n=1 Tax=Hibiscus sabdariffa TaxID=183260 RepID=A0ABR2E320_9ROSI
MDPDPPLHETYKALFANTKISSTDDDDRRLVTVEERELPLIDLSRLSLNEAEQKQCKEEIARAGHEWGFFQVINHGISMELLEKLREEQVRVFKQPFRNKFLNFSDGSYRWGTPTATSLRQLSWSEAFHIPMTDISSSSMEPFATKVASLAQKLAEILADKLGHNSTFFQQSCLPSSCYLRLNRYPPCLIPSDIYGLMPHTDSDFLTILNQDQAWSNGFYNSVEHCVVTHPTKERFSAAYFLCPSYETVIESCSQPSVYSKFSFREYKQKVQEDVQRYGYKNTHQKVCFQTSSRPKLKASCTETCGTEQEWLLWNEGGNFPIDELLRWVHIALLCVQDDPALRPAVSSAILLLRTNSAARFLHMIYLQPSGLPSSFSGNTCI